jgi:hypothetical protein
LDFAKKRDFKSIFNYFVSNCQKFENNQVLAQTLNSE